MDPHELLTAEIESGAAGPHVAALFDLDGTLIAGFSISAFWRDRVMSGRWGVREVRETLTSMTGYRRGQVSFSGLMTVMAGFMRGTPEEEFVELGERLFEEEIAGLIYPESRKLVEAHQRMGHTVAIVSSATRYQIDPIARDLGIEHVLCTRLEVEDGNFTGHVITPTCFGEGKVEAARGLANSHGIDLDKSFFYSDSSDDLALLQAVGSPRALNPDRRLEQIARRRVWPAHHFTSRGRPTARDAARTGAAVGAALAAPLIALPALLINRDARQYTNAVLTAASDVPAAIAGVDLRVEGEEHLWSHRPAVFVFNHQSAIDATLVSKMVRRDIVAVGKIELRPPGPLGRLLEAAGAVFVDRKNHSQAIAALDPVVRAIAHGRSLLIAPEGTRSPTPRLGRFKKGAFHIAMRARVPIVPIIFHNALDAMPKHAWIVRPATVHAKVLPPIPTTDWRREDLDEHIAKVRALFLEALDRAD